MLRPDGLCLGFGETKPGGGDLEGAVPKGRTVEALPPPVGEVLAFLRSEATATGGAAHGTCLLDSASGTRHLAISVFPYGPDLLVALCRDETERWCEEQVTLFLHAFDRDLLAGRPVDQATRRLLASLAGPLGLAALSAEIIGEDFPASGSGLPSAVSRAFDFSLTSGGLDFGKLRAVTAGGELDIVTAAHLAHVTAQIADSLLLVCQGRGIASWRGRPVPRPVERSGASYDLEEGEGSRSFLARHLSLASAAAREGKPSTLLLLDLDNFRSVNDTAGHQAGDLILGEVATLLREGLRPLDLVTHLGSDEFAILLRGVPPETGQLTAERLRRSVADRRFRTEGHAFDLGVSIGAVGVDGKLEPAALVSVAESALSTAKNRGRNSVVAAEPDRTVHPTLAEASRWASRVKDALREGNLVLQFQPVVRLADGVAAHHEALVRLLEPSGELIPPGRFLGAVEQFGLLPQLDGWVVARVLDLLRGRPGAHVFVNLSGASLGSKALLDEIEERVRSGRERRGQISFELTESTALRDPEGTAAWMERLSAHGCKFALDDFGIGFSSFSYLRLLPVGFVKIDGSFIRGLATSPENRALVQAIETVATTLGKETIAESVESAADAEEVRQLGITYGQGYALGRPAASLPESTR